MRMYNCARSFTTSMLCPHNANRHPLLSGVCKRQKNGKSSSLLCIPAFLNRRIKFYIKPVNLNRPNSQTTGLMISLPAQILQHNGSSQPFLFWAHAQGLGEIYRNCTSAYSCILLCHISCCGRLITAHCRLFPAAKKYRRKYKHEPVWSAHALYRPDIIRSIITTRRRTKGEETKINPRGTSFIQKSMI